MKKILTNFAPTMPQLKHIIIFCLLAASLFRCSCNDEPKPDPCMGKTATSAGFKIYTNIETGSPFYAQQIETFNDTIIFNRIDSCCRVNDVDSVRFWAFQSDLSLTFKATDATAISYVWIIGDNIVNYTTAGVTLLFNQKTTPRKMDIRLIVTKDVNKQCFPNDKSIDTVVRTIYFRTIQVGEKHPIEGIYKGYLNNDPKDTITLSIDRTSTDEFRGVQYPGTVSYQFSTSRIFCNPSISNIGWIKEKKIEEKLYLPKRTEINIKNRCFYTDATMDGMGFIDSKKELILQVEALNVYYENISKTYQYNKENYTFTGTKQ